MSEIWQIISICYGQVSFFEYSSEKIKEIKKEEISAIYFSEVESLYPKNFVPDIIVFYFPEYEFVPIDLEKSSAFLVALTSDWNTNLLHLFESLKRFDLIITDLPGKEILNKNNFANVIYYPFAATLIQPKYFSEKILEKEFDIGFVGNFNSDIQTERNSYLYRIASLGNKYQVSINTDIDGEKYGEFIAKSKITFNRSVRGELNMRVFEAFLGKSLLFLEESNQEYHFFFKDRQELVLYNQDNLEELLEYYLENEKEREIITSNGYNFFQKYSYNYFKINFFQKIIENITENKQKRENYFTLSDKNKEKVILENCFYNKEREFFSRNIEKFYFLPQIEKDHPEYYFTLLIEKEMVKEEDFQKISSEYPENVFNYLNYLFFLKKQKKYEEALHLINKTKEILEKEDLIINGPFFDSYLYNDFFLEIQRHSRFRIEFQKLISENNVLAELKKLFFWKLLIIEGELLEVTKRIGLALEKYCQADQLISICYLKTRKAIIYKKINKIREAYESLLEGFKMDPFNLSNWYNLVLIEKENDYSLESPEKRQWLTIINSSEFFNKYLDEVFNYQEEYLKHLEELIEKSITEREKLNLAKKILKIDSNSFVALAYLGKDFLLKGEYKKAIDLLAKALSLKKDKELIQLIADCLKNLGDENTFKGFKFS